MKPPQHIAIICDGNRRWAKTKNKSEFAGHKYATDHTVEALVDHCLKLKIPHLTFWVLSTENWKRGKTWMQQYFKLMHYFFDKKLDILTKKGAKITYIGDLSPFPKSLQTKIKKVVNQSKNNSKITINIAINYGGRDEILRAINKLIADRRSNLCEREGWTLKDSSPSAASDLRKITSKQFERYLDTANLPDPDLLIRTGENNTRLSGFMPWQITYTQLYFSNTLFPNFTPEKLQKAISWWQQQTQNLGK